MTKLSQWAKFLTLALCLNGCSDPIIPESALTKQTAPYISINEIKDNISLEKRLTTHIHNSQSTKPSQETQWYPQPNIPYNSLKIHIKNQNIPNDFFIYIADSKEFISNENTPRIGLNADNPEGTGDDINISKQRLMYQLHYFLRKDNTLKIKILDVFPYRAARAGFGFEEGSNQTPTGLYLLTPQRIASSVYGPINEQMGITGATIDMWNILDQEGNSIYFETRGPNSPHNRQIVHHPYLYQHHQIYLDKGSMGCLHLLANDARNMFNFTFLHNRVPVYISGSSNEDLPQREQKLNDFTNVFFWEYLKLGSL